MCKNSAGYNRTRNFGLYGHAESKKTQKFVFRSALRPNQISFSHDQDPQERCSALNCCCAKLGIRGRSSQGNFLIDQIANQEHVGRLGTNHVAALVGKMPDMDKVRRLSKPDRWLRLEVEAGMA